MKNSADLRGCYPSCTFDLQNSLICKILHIIQKLNSIIAECVAPLLNLEIYITEMKLISPYSNVYSYHVIRMFYCLK